MFKRRKLMVEEIKLQARTSALMDQSGYARIHTDVHDLLDMQENGYAELINDKGKAILVRISSDKLIQKDNINLGTKDLEKMEIEDGSLITIKHYKTVGDSIGEFKDKMVSKLKKDDTKEKTGSE